MLYIMEWPMDVKNSLESLWMSEIVRNSLEEALYGSVMKIYIKTVCSITGKCRYNFKGLHIYIYHI